MIRTLLLGSLFLLGSLVKAQGYGNEWIEPGKRYWVFSVAREGLFRIDSTAMADAGFPVGEVDPHHLQVFGREKQLHIHVQGEADSVINTGDYVEFYAPRNDAWLDSAMWGDPSHISDPTYSFHNDTIRYFLTWDPTPGSQRRLVNVTQGDWTSYPARTWLYCDLPYTVGNLYHIGQRSTVGASTSDFGKGEGYFRRIAANSTNNGAVQTFTFSTPSAYNTAEYPPARIKAIFAGVNSSSKDLCIDHHMIISAGSGDVVLKDTTYQGYEILKLDLEMPTVQMSASTAVRFKVPHDLVPCGAMDADYPDWQGVSWLSLRYVRSPHMATQPALHLYIPPVEGQSFAYLIVTGSPNGGIFYSFGPEPRRMPLIQVGNSLRCNIAAEPDGEDAHVFYSANTAVMSITKLAPVNGTGYFSDLLAGPVDSVLVIITHPTLKDAAEAYGASRAASPVNPSIPMVVDVNELYLQYGGGVVRHPLAIRRFMKHLYEVADVPPKALLLIGKGVQAPRVDGDAGHRIDTTTTKRCLVPTYGFPCSDAMFTLGLSGQAADLTVPVGRIAALTPAEVLAYRDKVEALEAHPPAAWMKDILHFRGGTTPSEVALFNNALNSYQAEVEDTLFMGRVIKFQKQGDQPITGAPADSVRMFIENGVTMMTFFAHAFGENFDITISEPQLYQWNGKHPLMIGNSCFTGNIHKYGNVSASERFVLTEGTGAIAFMSSVDIGLLQYLAPYTRDLYKSFSEVNYGKGLGEHLRYATAQQLAWGGVGDINLLNNVQTFTLHGDPTLVMNSPRLADLDIHDADVKVIPDVVTADLDSFQVRVVVRNIGKGTHAPFRVTLDRAQVNSTDPPQSYQQQMSLQHYQDTIYFTLPVIAPGFGPGLNDLRVRVDIAPDVIPELNELSNNQAGTLLQIISGDLIPVYPYDLSVVPHGQPFLRASTGDPFAAPKNYLFQIDTTDTFNSPMMEQATINAPGGVVEWQPNNIFSLNTATDSLVYYWRTTLDSTGSGLYNWRQQSFQYIQGKRGWGQSHFLQFKPNTFNLFTYDLPGRSFNYFTGTKTISVSVTGNSGVESQWSIDLEPQEYWGCTSVPAMHVGVVDPVGFVSWISRYNGTGRYFGNQNNDGACRGRNERYFIFKSDSPAQLDSLGSMITNAVPDGHYVVVYTFLRLKKATLEPSMAWNALAAVGAQNLTNGTVQDSVPYILIFRKGDPSSAIEVWGDSATAAIDASMSVTLNARSGSMIAPRAGPVQHWDELSWYAAPNLPSDSVRIGLAGYSPTGQVPTPLAEWHGTSGSIQPLDVAAPAGQYPFLRVDGHFSNEEVLSPEPAQLKRWHLLATPAPECAIDPPSGYYTYLNGIFQGETGAAMVAIRNIGDLPMDSLLVAAWVVGTNNQRQLVHYKRNAPLPMGGVLQDTIRFSTTSFGGNTSLFIEANPIDTVTGVYDQLEQFHGNNVATIQFSTVADRIQPMLDLTFDGIHILNGDIVSSRPEIEIMLDDENQVLLMDSPADTACFKLFLTRPNGQMEILPFIRNGEEVLRFIPATSEDNVSRIKYNGRFEQDGRYKLLVTAKDKSNNTSSTREHVVEFEVINRPTITEVLNYPNPFTTSTRFVFTLTGHERPTAMRIQIMTVTGRVVREIAMNELGDLRVGRNITDYAWDGTDQFGDRLARGVYLYRVIAQLNGQDIEYRETSAGSLFTKGFGKMYLLR